MNTVIDSSTWIDAILYGGVPREAVFKAFELGLVVGCDQLWAEIHWVLTRKYQPPEAVIIDTLTFYRMHSLHIDVTGSVRDCSDPDDDFVLECAVGSGARVIVASDLKHLVRMGSFECIPILTPDDLLVPNFPDSIEQ